MVNASAVLPLNSQTLLGFNQETYQHLQVALQSAPSHRLWIAVCDDLTLQRQVAAALDRTLLTSAVEATESPVSWYCLEESNPNWVTGLVTQSAAVPGLTYRQILGVEQFTYQSSDQQYQFLASLRQLASHYSRWPCSFLLWLPHPWLQQVRRSAPELFRRCDRVFKFLGDPRPLPASSLTSNPAIAEPGPWGGIHPLSSPQPVEISAADQTLSELSLATSPPVESVTIDADLSLSLGQMHSLPPELWQRLSVDLSQLEQPASGSAVPPITAPLLDSASHDFGLLLASPQNADQQNEDAAVSFPATTWTEAHRLRDQVEGGDHSVPLLKAAIAQYEAILDIGNAADPQCAEGLNDLGSLYWMWAQQVTDSESRQHHLQQSIRRYESALALEGDPLQADTLMRIHSNLGSVYCLQAAHGRSDYCLGQAVGAFHRALQYVDAEQDQALYVTVQTHLGTAYWSLAQQTHTPEYLHQAILAYGEALRRCPGHSAPSSYGQLQNNLGITYWSLAQHERPLFLLKEAISAYQNALAYRTLAVDPVGYGATQNNLGTAYWDLGRQYARGDAQQHQAWHQAISAYEAALSLSYEQSAQGFDLWATHHSLGVVYEQLALQKVSTSQSESFQVAIDHYVQAMDGWQTEQATLAQTAFQSILNNLRHQAEYLGLAAQQKSLAQIPAALLPEIWRHL